MTRAIAIAGALVLPLVPSEPASGKPRELHVASKGFTESVILGEIVAHVARATGTAVVHHRELGGTRLLWNALLAGEVDLYPDYTGTLLEEILAGAARERGADDWAFIRAELGSRGIAVLGPLGFNNTYAMGMRRSEALGRGIRRTSDLAAHLELRFGFSNEFMSRQDGWPRLRDRYQLPHKDVTGIDHDLAYRALEQGSIHVTDLYSTDAELASQDLQILDDDRAVFPRYEAVLLVRQDRERDLAPALALLGKLAGRIDERAMREMNARAKLGRVPEGEVAADFVRRTLGIEARSVAPGRAAAILQRTGEHLVLVGISLAAAVLLAIPLGILAARRPLVGRVVLDAVGIVQTVPSLALLVFMIPLLGIGAVPAAVALFLYSLLPIVRNTHAGLRDVAPALREAAAALGLPPRAVLRLVELPMASRAILAGIKSAAVINVGTATLGALVGAGGLGQPILTGIRLDDVSLLLEGAVPASVLALAVGWVFDLIERAVVPRGLRLKT